MYNLIIAGAEDAWDEEICEMSLSRMFEHTTNEVKAQFGQLTLDGSIINPKIDLLRSFPAVLGYEERVAKPAKLTNITALQYDNESVRFRWRPLEGYAEVANIWEDPLAFDLGINSNSWENSRTHWAVKDVNILEVWPKVEAAAAMPEEVRVTDKTVFVVHGHDEGMKHSVARFLERSGLEPVILSEQPDQGRTIIEKFADHAGMASFAVVLMSPDDVGGKDSSNLRFRARQNVVLELGYFSALLGRKRVCALKKGDLEIPSDFFGVVYKDYDDGEGWKVGLARELRAAGYTINPQAFV